MTPPVRIYTRMFVVDDGWVDISSYVLQRAGVTATSGRTQTSGEVVPSTFECQLNNRDGRFSPRNPTSPYYELIGQGTPLRCGIGGPLDAFGRAVSSGWGSTDTGQTWATFGSGGVIAASDYNVASGAGTHSVPAAAAFRATYLDGYAARDVDVAVTVTVPVTNITGGALQPANLLLRGQSSTEYYLVRVEITTAEAVTIGILHADGTVLAAAVTTSITHTSAQALRVRAACEGQTIAAKVWPAAESEPYDWDVVAHDDSITAAGWVGVRSGVATGNTNALPMVFSYDNLHVEYPIFFGGALEWPPQWDQSGTDVWVALQAAGAMHRLGQGTDPLQSAPRRYLPDSDGKPPVAYWPLEDGPLSTTGAAVVGVHEMVLSSPAAPSRHWGQGRLGPWLNPGLALFGGDSITASVSMPDQTPGDVEWAVDHIRAGDPTTDTLLVISCGGTFGTAVQTWSLRFIRTAGTPDGTITVTTPTDVDTTAQAAGVWDGLPHHIRFFVEQSDPDQAAWYIDIDGNAVKNSFTTPAVVLLPVERVTIEDETAHSEPFAVGHVVVYGNTRPTADFADPPRGYPDEAAGRRAERLAEENELVMHAVGDLDDTQAMGPQGLGSFLQLVHECARTAVGTVLESRIDDGLVFRTLRSKYNQEAALTLDYAAGHLGETPRIRDDTRDIRNRWTVRRVNGGELARELASGRMSTAAPEAGGIGPRPDTLTVNVATDAQLRDIADWVLHVSTVDEPRWPRLVTTNLRKTPDLIPAALALNIDDLVELENPKAGAGAPETVRQLVDGRTITADSQSLVVTAQTVPASPYEVVVFEDTDRGRLADNGTTTLASGIDAETPGTADTLSGATATGPLWTTDAARFPLTVAIGGERITVTAISGATSPQTFTVERGANGVSKAHAAGAVIRLVPAVYIGL